MINSNKSRVTPAVGAALVAAAGAVWVIQQLPPSGTDRQDDSDRLIRLEANSSSSATAAMIVKTSVRGEIFNQTRSLSQLHVEEVWVRSFEVVDAVVIVEQEGTDGRQTVGCDITDNGKSSGAKRVTVRVGEKKSVTCRHTG